MPENWGYIAVRASEDQHKAIQQSASCLDKAKLFIEISGVDISESAINAKGFESLKSVDGYLVLKYFCADWLNLSEIIYGNKNPIEYYAWHGDEYGTRHYYALNQACDPIYVDYLCEEDDEDHNKKVDLGSWIRSLPKQILVQYPEFVQLTNDEYVEL